MIIRGSTIPQIKGRKDYGIGLLQDKLGHFTVRVTTPDNPFTPHKHDGLEFWYIIEGEGIVTLDDAESPIKAGDLVVLKPWVTHGLRTETSVRWICFG